MRSLSIQEMRCIQIEILDDVDRFCRKNGIRYSLCGGSLLGAIRHRGYIPWDDDIDIMMPRLDYDRFILLYESKDNYVLDFSNEEGYCETFVKICRKDTLVVDGLLNRAGFGVNIDLFPIDGAPLKNPDRHVDDILMYKTKIAKYCPYYKRMTTRRGVWLVKYIAKRLLNVKFTPILRLKSELCDALRKSHFEDSPLAGVISGSYGHREVMDKSIFLSYTEILFEGKLYFSIARYEEYLASIYGDYMALPPIEERKNPHNYNAFVLND